MDFLGQEGVRGADDGADVEVVLPVLDRHVESVASRVQVGDDGLTAPIAVGVHHIATVAVAQQLPIPVLVGREGPSQGPTPTSRWSS